MSGLKLQDKVAIVTGGASGIGEVTARCFADHGVRAVVIADIQPEKGRAVAQSIGPHRCSFFQCDVAEEEQVKSMIEWTVQTYGGLHVFFSNAGIVSNLGQTILELNLSEYDAVMRVNARGMATCMKHAGRMMVELGIRGDIVRTSSMAGVMASQSYTDYTMSKHALMGLVRAASLQLGPHGIRVNCVSPAGVVTPTTVKAGVATAEEMERAMGPFTNLKGVALTLANVAEAVLFLASEDSGFLTGHKLMVDGVVCLESDQKSWLKFMGFIGKVIGSRTDEPTDDKFHQ